MANFLRWRAFLLVSVTFFCIAGSCLGQQDDSWWLVSPQLLRAANLEVVWQNKLPIKKDESLSRLISLGDRIYGLSDRNYIVSLSKEDGNPIFGRPLALSTFPVLGMGLYDNSLFTIIGNKLIEINPDSGKEESNIALAMNVACPAARNNSCYYIASTNRRLYALRAKDNVKIFEVAAENDSPITSIIAEENFVIFATDAGNVVNLSATRPLQHWQFKAAGGVLDPIVKDGDSLFVSSKDMSVYKVDIATGQLVWKYATGTIPDAGPVVGKNVVYQNLRVNGLVAIDKRDGKLIWQLPKGIDVLAESGTKAYVLTRTGRLVVMDNSKAEQLYSINFAGVSKYITNVEDSRIYIADDTGRIACLRPEQ